MRLIAHRGNVNGLDPAVENTAVYLDRALRLGFDVECDVTLDGGRLWLGHDSADEETSVEFLSRQGVWCHAKTVETMHHLLDHPSVHAFFQAEDEVALTTRGALFTHSRCRDIGARAVVVIPEFDASRVAEIVKSQITGLCTDFVADWQRALAPAPEAIHG